MGSEFEHPPGTPQMFDWLALGCGLISVHSQKFFQLYPEDVKRTGKQ